MVQPCPLLVDASVHLGPGGLSHHLPKREYDDDGSSLDIVFFSAPSVTAGQSERCLFKAVSPSPPYFSLLMSGEYASMTAIGILVDRPASGEEPIDRNRLRQLFDGRMPVVSDSIPGDKKPKRSYIRWPNPPLGPNHVFSRQASQQRDSANGVSSRLSFPAIRSSSGNIVAG